MCNPNNYQTIINGNKNCRKCGLWKSVYAFSMLRGSPIAICKGCKSEQNLANYYKRKNSPPFMGPTIPKIYDGQKRCTNCREWKDIEIGFYKSPGTVIGKGSKCIECSKLLRNRERDSINSKRWHKNNPKRSAEKCKKYRMKYPILVKEKRRLNVEKLSQSYIRSQLSRKGYPVDIPELAEITRDLLVLHREIKRQSREMINE